MLVTGVQPVGAKGVNAVQVAAVDPKEVSRTATATETETERGAPGRNRGTQPIVFPRQGLPLDQRPVALRHKHAAARYQHDGDSDADA